MVAPIQLAMYAPRDGAPLLNASRMSNHLRIGGKQAGHSVQEPEVRQAEAPLRGLGRSTRSSLALAPFGVQTRVINSSEGVAS